jgi:hypothetical protein
MDLYHPDLGFMKLGMPLKNHGIMFFNDHHAIHAMVSEWDGLFRFDV